MRPGADSPGYNNPTNNYAMSAESKEVDLPGEEDSAYEARNAVEKSELQDDDSGEEEGEAEGAESANTETVASNSTTKKKKSKKAKLKRILGGGKGNDTDGVNAASNPASKLTSGMVEQLLEMNPSLKGEVAGMNKERAAETLKGLEVADLLTGMVRSHWLYTNTARVLTSHSLSVERTKRTWHPTNFGRLSRYLDLVCPFILQRWSGPPAEYGQMRHRSLWKKVLSRS